MLRKLAIVVLILAVIGAAVFWLVTIPATVPASALPAYAPNLENGNTMVSQRGVIETIAAGLARWRQSRVVLDPVMPWLAADVASVRPCSDTGSRSSSRQQFSQKPRGRVHQAG